MRSISEYSLTIAIENLFDEHPDIYVGFASDEILISLLERYTEKYITLSKRLLDSIIRVRGKKSSNND